MSSQQQQRNVTLYLKIPNKPISLLQRLEASQLESLIEHKVIDAAAGIDLRRIRIFELPSSSQIKGTVEVVDGELMVRFPARRLGIHTARVFANTTEVCRPVAFIVKQSGEVESIDISQAILEHTDSGLASGTSTVRGVESQPTIPFYLPSSPLASPTGIPPHSSVHQQFDPLSPYKQQQSGSRPTSGHFEFPTVPRGANDPGDLFGRPSGASFEQLLTAKMTKQVIPGISHSTASSHPTSTTEFMTPDALMKISREAKQNLGTTFGKQMKKRCNICTRKTKPSKRVLFWEMDFCDSCCKRNYMQRSAIEHFMTPSIQELPVQVPMNKRGTKLTTVRRIMPNVNLRGLDPVDIRNAMTEFHKFDLDGDGWMDNAVLLPVLKACFTYSLPHHEIKNLIHSPSLTSMMESMGLNKRTKVHHIEYLALLAFISRERQRLTHDLIPNSKFTHNDLEMAYAFKNQFPRNQQHSHTHPHKQPPSEKPRLLPGNDILARSYTVDSPLSKYQPTSLSDNQPPLSPTKQPLMTTSGIPHTTSTPTPRENEEEEEEEEEELPPMSPTSQTTNNENDKKSKKNQQMEQLKLTGDPRSDAWMLY